MQIRIDERGMSHRQLAYAALLARKHQATKCKAHTYETPTGCFVVRMGKTLTVRMANV